MCAGTLSGVCGCVVSGKRGEGHQSECHKGTKHTSDTKCVGTSHAGQADDSISCTGATRSSFAGGWSSFQVEKRSGIISENFYSLI